MSDTADLEARLRAVEPGWQFVKARDLAQLHRWLRDRGRRVPPDLLRPIALSKRDAEASACFPEGSLVGAPEDLVLVTSPSERGIADWPSARQLAHFWRGIYASQLPMTNAARVWQSLPRVLKRDAEMLLKATGCISEDATDSELARAFAADLLTVARFAPGALPHRYPGFADSTAWRARLTVGFDEEGLYRSSRPYGAAESHPPTGDPEEVPPRTAVDAAATHANGAHAEEARRNKNFARAAILFAMAEQRSESESALRTGIVERLAPIMAWNAARQHEWNSALQALLPQAILGRWSPAAKALYDLQKIAVDLEGDLFAVDPWGWVRSFGRRPVVRKLALSRLALVHRHLLKVKKHLLQMRSAPPVLSGLLDEEIHRAESALRAAMEPILDRVLRGVGFAPSNVVEGIALRKIVAELLDLTAAKGFLRIGDLRDTLARNRLKMPDLAGPIPFFRGDALLQADRKLGAALDGIYYPGEIYLRWFQRGSALAFGTKIGRWVSLFVAAPFGAAFMTVEFAKYMVHEVGAIAGFIGGLFASGEAPVHADADAKAHGVAMSPESIAIVLALGVLNLGLIHSTAIRGVALRLLGDVGAAIGWLFGTLPGRVWNSGPMRTIRLNPVVKWCYHRLVVPAAGAGVAALVVAQLDLPTVASEWWILGTFAALVLLLNTAGGQRLQERAGDGLAWTWRAIRTNFLPGLLGWIVWFFRGFLDALDRLIYTVDEWFHFRNGQSKPSLVLKISLAAVWFPIRYALRFAIYLLIEPQINPVKHFPVVTVSHKLLLPMIPAISTATGISTKWVTGAMSGVPGIFGFLAWELKENWRLYAANRPPRLRPLALGHHGETMRGLLRVGFHSGTVPKAYAAIRKAWDRAEWKGTPADLHKPLDVPHHVGEAVHHFADRELIAHLKSSAAWADVPLRCDRVTLGLQHIRIDIRGNGAAAVMHFELVDSRIAAECADAEFLAEATVEQRECWERAVLGFAAMGAAHVDDTRLEWDEWVSFWEMRKA